MFPDGLRREGRGAEGDEEGLPLRQGKRKTDREGRERIETGGFGVERECPGSSESVAECPEFLFGPDPDV
jgi:hypothetical protein